MHHTCTYMYVCIYSAHHPMMLCICAALYRYMIYSSIIHTYVHSTYVRTDRQTDRHTYIHTIQYNTLQNITKHYNPLQCITIHYRTLPYITIHYMHYIHTYVRTYIRACLHAYLPTYLPTYLHAYLPTYRHADIHRHAYTPTRFLIQSHDISQLSEIVAFSQASGGLPEFHGTAAAGRISGLLQWNLVDRSFRGQKWGVFDQKLGDLGDGEEMKQKSKQ